MYVCGVNKNQTAHQLPWAVCTSCTSKLKRHCVQFLGGVITLRTVTGLNWSILGGPAGCQFDRLHCTLKVFGPVGSVKALTSYVKVN